MPWAGVSARVTGGRLPKRTGVSFIFWLGAGGCRGGLAVDRRIPEKVAGELEDFTVMQACRGGAGTRITPSATQHGSVVFP